MKRNSNKSAAWIALAGLVAAAYTVLSLISGSLGLASGAIQVRLSEALCVLPYFSFAAVPGLAVGCFLSNLLMGCAPWDIVFGTLATLIGAIGIGLMRKTKKSGIAWIPPVVSNVLIIPPVLVWVYGVETAYPLLLLSVAAGEVIACGLLGRLVMQAARRLEHKSFLLP